MTNDDLGEDLLFDPNSAGEIKIIRTIENVEIELVKGGKYPLKAHKEDAAYDLHARIEWGLKVNVINPMEILVIPVGFKMKIPVGYKANILPRSGLAYRHGITILNSPGTIDAGYRDEVKVILINLGSEPHTIADGDRIAQMDFQKVLSLKIKEVEKLSPDDHDRKGGLGSTGDK